MKPRFRLRSLLAGALVLGLALATGATSASAERRQRLGGMFRYWEAEHASDLRDYIVYWVQDLNPSLGYHVQYEYWDFVAPQSHDHARPEIGVHFRDFRRSAYTAQWRHEYRRDRYTLATDQVVADHWVARAEISPIVWPDSTETVFGVGADYYWASWNFASATVIRDPRGEDFWSFPMRVRLATERNDWVQVTVAPATHRSLGWALDGMFRGFRAGIERNSRYDFTNEDNVILTIGYEREWPKRE